eukprot:scaffold287_cov337-Pavlova_lutheri.AAC.25
MPGTAKVTVGELLASSKFVHTLERCKADATLLGNPTFQGGTRNFRAPATCVDFAKLQEEA